MKQYTGIRHHDYFPVTKDCTSVFVTVDDVKTPIVSYFPNNRSFDNPLDWGTNHTGYGATNLSASILADYLELWKPENAEFHVIPRDLIVGFRDVVVRTLDWKNWSIDEEAVVEFLEEFTEAREEAIEAQIEASDNWEEEALNELVFPSNYPSGFSADFDEYRGADSV